MKLFSAGLELEQIPVQLADEILEQVRQQPFITSQNYDSMEGTAPQITEWDAELDREIIHATNSPPYFQALWRSIADTRFNWIQKTFGPFSQGSVILNKYPRGHQMRWHSDTLDGTYIQTLIYVTADAFEIADGGYLEMGRCGVTKHGVYDKGPIEVLKTILPNHGTMVNMLNTDPTLLHRVVKVDSDKERYTVVLRFGYIENTFTVKKWQTIKGI